MNTILYVQTAVRHRSELVVVLLLGISILDAFLGTVTELDVRPLLLDPLRGRCWIRLTTGSFAELS